MHFDLVKFVEKTLMNLENMNSIEILKIYKSLYLYLKKDGFSDYCLEKYGEYKSVCIIEILKILSIDYVLINDNFTNTQGINTDKVNNLMEALQTLNLLVG